MSSSDEIAGSSRRTPRAKPSSTAAGGSSRQGRLGGSGAVVGGTRRSDSEGSYDEEQPRCHLCLHDLVKNPKRLATAIKGYTFHSECYNAVRCARRIAGSHSDAQDVLMRTQPELWRAQVLPLVKRDGHRRDQAARNMVRTSLEMSTYKASEVVTEHMILSKKRFKSYKKFWDDECSEAASQTFDELHSEQGGKHDTADGLQCIAVEDNTRLRTVKGSASKSTSALSKDLPEAQAVADDRGRGSGQGDACPSHSSRGRSSRRAGREGDRRRHDERRADEGVQEGQRRGSHLDAHGGEVSGGREAKRARCRDSQVEPVAMSAKKARATEVVVQPSPSRVREKVKPPPLITKTAPAGDDSDDIWDEEDEEDGEESAKKQPEKESAAASSRAYKVGKGGEVSQKMTPVAFIQAKSAACQAAKAKLADGTGPKSQTAKITASMDRLTEEELKKLEGDPKAVIELMATADSHLAELSGAIEHCRLSSWPELFDKLQAAGMEVDKARNQAMPIDEALQYLVDQKVREAKSKKNADRYKHARVAKKFLAGGWTKSAAKTLATAVEMHTLSTPLPAEVEVNPAKFDHTKITLWRVHVGDGGDAGETSEEVKQRPHVLEHMHTIAANSNIKERSSELEKALEMNTGWGGAMSKLELGAGVSVQTLKEFEESELLEQRGSDPWVAALRPYAARVGPSHWPLPGVGSLFQHVGGSNDFWVLLGPASKIVAKGLALSDIESFLSTPSGEEWVGQSTVLPVQKEEVLWVPYGWIAMPVSVLPKTSEGTTDGADFVLVQAVAHSGWAVADGACFAAVADWNRAHLSKVATKRAWASRHTFFEALVEAARAHTT